MKMRVIQIHYAEPEKLYNKSTIAEDLIVSVRTFERYILNDELKYKTQVVGKTYIFKGSDVNERIDELLKGDKFVDKFVLIE